MPEYDFAILSPQDFELLTRDVLNAEYSLRLVSHPAGRDQGIDLRGESETGERIVVQCKHYANSRWPDLQSAVRKEAARERQPDFDRYVFVTSQPLTAHRRDWIIEEYGKAGFDMTLNDVWGQDDLNSALGVHTDVERRHFKLWLASTNVLQTMLRAGEWQRREELLDRAEHHAKVWVAVPEYDEARRLLEQHGVVVLAGPPGAGKSMLAEMLVLEAAREGWNVLPVSSDIDEAWPVFGDDSRQIVYYDDFLGTYGLKPTGQVESVHLMRFIDKVRTRRGSKRLVLTTREQILRRAIDVDDRLSRLDGRPGTGIVRLDGYSPAVKAHMLFNHLYFSPLGPDERVRLAADNRLLTAVEHPSYNPRLVEQVTGEIDEGSTADEVTERLLTVLDHPQDLWHATFRNMDRLGRDILLTLVTLSPLDYPVEQLRELVEVPDAVLWTPALRELEPTWLRVLGQGREASVTFANPGCEDYLLTVLDDIAVASECLARVRRIDQYFELTMLSGLIAGTIERPDLAYVLTQQRDQIVARLRELASAGGLPDVRAATTLAAVHGTERTTGWVFELVEDRCASWAEATYPTLDYLLLAEQLSGVPTDDSARRLRLVHMLVTAGLVKAKTIQDLDAYEALPESLLPDGSRDRMRERAHAIIQAEVDDLTYHSDDAEILVRDAHALRQRASNYGFDLDIAALVDRAEDLAHESEPVEWPAPDDEDDDPAAVFRRLAD